MAESTFNLARRVLRRLIRNTVNVSASQAHRLFNWPLHPFYCPLCENPLMAWEGITRDVGLKARRIESAPRRCPRCRSFERTRHIWLYLEQEHLLDGAPVFLHFAPEQGLAPKLRQRLGSHYVTADLFMRGVNRREDITALSFSEHSFGLIYCSNVLEHVTDDRAAMRELYRVLRPGALAIVQVPLKGETTCEDWSITDPRERAIHFGQADHVRYYGEDIAERLAEAGFEVTPIYMPDALKVTKAEIIRMNLGVRELIHLCRKTL